MDTEYYKNLILSMLENNTYYEKLTYNNPQKTLKNLSSLFQIHGMGLTTHEIDYLSNFKYSPSLFYRLPNIHKNPLICEACKVSTSLCINVPPPTNLKLRPIIAGPSCETHHLSNFLDILLKPLLKYVKSYIRDDLDMLNHLLKTVKDRTLLVSFNMVNLYTNIPHDYGIEAITFWLEKYPEEIPGRINQNFVIEVLKFVLLNNHFLFDTTYYRQKCGIAMGTRAAPVIANLVMGYHELK
ncbi:uncharacterized protein LOC115220725 [Octopus sinensis]|uniref:Uncharacterized protein LOC115220725 n=1 Tax=Octopus sinensis TaxID=2607531 RepID=A0A6P7T926_9MOLL|nr:uncharacterized protein LOC115220725 [Octopus sinensis]